MSEPAKQVHLGAAFPGVNNHTVWSDPRSGSQIDFSSFRHLPRTAERGKFDFFLLAEGLRPREHRGKIFDLDVVGRPDTLPVLSALAAVTDRIGLAGTVNATSNEPFELARQFATVDHLSGGRAAWNVVTSSDAFTGANFRRGGFLDHADRYSRAAEFVEAARALWDAWAPDAVVADPTAGVFAKDKAIAEVRHRGTQFDITARPTVSRGPQGHPVLIQAGNPRDGRELAAATADAIYTIHAELAAGRAFYTDVKSRLATYRRAPEQLKILPQATFVLGDTEAETRERARHIRLQQVTPQGAIEKLEQVWRRDLSGYDPDGPLPDVEPRADAVGITRGRARHHHDPLAVARHWRQVAEAKSEYHGTTLRDHLGPGPAPAPVR
ncbi:NtaA/DmoA family FMN-dependent monooxygenase [Streptomyces sp. 11-1-2]|uniref:NtaA/DmoA family FMN-dependent monooxygenase n=1 Tax=unclassified Streptomyces TaxID=2593676 RepID=UPI000B8D7E1C|nr:NtaA/DmoA family FMN-dependent monooxygenase [Streptomyces sp. 11-1-2]ASQ92085.1 F420-dependent methylene-tetrahydromethanopterin reductase [Streptomyces sp. 11-1-2]